MNILISFILLFLFSFSSAWTAINNYSEYEKAALNALEYFEPFYDKNDLIFFNDPVEDNGEILIINKKDSYLVFSAHHKIFLNQSKILENTKNAKMFWRLKPRMFHTTDSNSEIKGYPTTYPTKNWKIQKINESYFLYIKHKEISSLLLNYEKIKNNMFLEFASYSSDFWHSETLLPRKKKKLILLLKKNTFQNVKELIGIIAKV